MKLSTHRSGRRFVAVSCAMLLASNGGTLLPAQEAKPAASPATSAASPATPEPEASKLPPEQLESLVAPIALYPDPLLAQVLVAASAEYGVTGVMTFIVSHDGIVYEKDLGPEMVEQFRTKELYDPDETWTAAENAEGTSTPPIRYSQGFVDTNVG